LSCNSRGVVITDQIFEVFVSQNSSEIERSSCSMASDMLPTRAVAMATSDCTGIPRLLEQGRDRMRPAVYTEVSP
jgi:hypothetical protein